MTKQNERCPFCNTVFKHRQGDYEYKESGLFNIFLQNITINECPECKNGPEIPNILGLHKCLTAVLQKDQQEYGNRYAAYIFAYENDVWYRVLNKVDESVMDRIADDGRKIWADVPDAANWVKELRGTDD